MPGRTCHFRQVSYGCSFASFSDAIGRHASAPGPPTPLHPPHTSWCGHRNATPQPDRRIFSGRRRDEFGLTRCDEHRPAVVCSVPNLGNFVHRSCRGRHCVVPNWCVTIQFLPRAASCYATRPSFSGSRARACGSERASRSIIDGLGKPGRFRVDQPTITGELGPAPDPYTHYRL